MTSREDLKTSKSFFPWLLALLTIVSYLLLPFYLFIIARRLYFSSMKDEDDRNPQDRSNIKHYSSFFPGLLPKRKVSLGTLSFFMIRRYLFVMLLIFGPERTIMQTMAYMGTTFSIMIYYAASKPYYSRFRYF